MVWSNGADGGGLGRDGCAIVCARPGARLNILRHWIFGYGSLIWRVDFPYHECETAFIDGWSRRFWQGSHDHRGTPDAPGRVLTLIPDKGARCVGMAYLVDEAVFEHLDHREKNGYERVDVEIRLADRRENGVTYIGAEGNFAYLGPAPLEEVAAQIEVSQGPSGRNIDYLLELDAALEKLGVAEPHVRSLRSLVERRTSVHGVDAGGA